MLNKAFFKKLIIVACSASVVVFACCVVVFAQSEMKSSAFPSKFKYDAQGKRNPFSPLLTADGRLLKVDDKKENQSIILEGIIYDPHGISYAMVSGDVLRIGDTFQGFQILKIEENRIILIKDSVLSQLELTKEAE
jgi:hypothetical protein